ncbi:putative bacteriophage protein [Methylorubrum populi]|uniref:Putative bacteriophage protein n=1 Tax=Methylorubrum populi TaxID=223967 RepID=A0A160PIU5_9HYPH|nr:phage minor head protein [Methylorubrum populi]BAU93399.1 putative bacteriophage protein [Methylorubrum populi]
MAQSPYRLDPRACPSCLRPRPPLLDGQRSGVQHRDRGPSPRSAFIRATKIVQIYETRLRSIAKHIGDILGAHDVASLIGSSAASAALRRYADTVAPWAEAVAERMVRETAARDERSWFKVASRMGRELKREIQAAPTGQVMRSLQTEQVILIRSIPLDAAERVQTLAREGLSQGMRAETLAKAIMEGEGVSRSKATLIARTECGRAATTLTRARAEHVGSTHFRWITVGDSDVRASHKKLNGKVFRWDDPPVCDEPDLKALPGAIFNCRCYPEPILDDL